MKLLVVNVLFAPQSIGGATRVVERNVAEFTSVGTVETSIFCSLEGFPPGERRCWRWNDIDAYGVGVSRTDWMDTGTDPQAIDAFSDVLDAIQPDLIHFHCIQTLGVGIVEHARDRAIPYVITMHDGWWVSDRLFMVDDMGTVRLLDYGANLEALDHDRRTGDEHAAGPSLNVEVIEPEKGGERTHALAPAIQGAATVLTVSEPFARMIRRAGVPADVRVVENGVPPISVESKITTDRPTVGYLAGVAPYKGYHLFRASLEALPRAEFDALVIDHSLPYGERVSERWGAVDVTRIGFVPQNEVARLYRRLHVVVVPSIWPESYGLIAREGALSGCWVIASNRGAAGTDVTHGIDGFVFDPSIDGDLRGVLDLINDDPARFLRPPPSHPLRSDKQQASELLKLYDDLINNER